MYNEVPQGIITSSLKMDLSLLKQTIKETDHIILKYDARTRRFLKRSNRPNFTSVHYDEPGNHYHLRKKHWINLLQQ